MVALDSYAYESRISNNYKKNKMLNNKIEGIALINNNSISQLQFTGNSGKIIYRDKIDSIIGIKHPGIILVDDIYGTTWVIHNHYQIGFPEVETLNNFAIGLGVIYDNRLVKYDAYEIVNRAINCWLNKKQYDWLIHNCQHFVNEVTQSKRHSETLDRVGNNLIAAGLTKAIIGGVAKNQLLTNIGIGVTVVGLIVKLFGNQ